MRLAGIVLSSVFRLGFTFAQGVIVITYLACWNGGRRCGIPVHLRVEFERLMVRRIFREGMSTVDRACC